MPAVTAFRRLRASNATAGEDYAEAPFHVSAWSQVFFPIPFTAVVHTAPQVQTLVKQAKSFVSCASVARSACAAAARSSAARKETPQRHHPPLKRATRQERCACQPVCAARTGAVVTQRCVHGAQSAGRQQQRRCRGSSSCRLPTQSERRTARRTAKAAGVRRSATARMKRAINATAPIMRCLYPPPLITVHCRPAATPLRRS